MSEMDRRMMMERRVMMLQEVCWGCESNGYAYHLDNNGNLILNCTNCNFGREMLDLRAFLKGYKNEKEI